MAPKFSLLALRIKQFSLPWKLAFIATNLVINLPNYFCLNTKMFRLAVRSAAGALQKNYSNIIRGSGNAWHLIRVCHKMLSIAYEISSTLSSGISALKILRKNLKFNESQKFKPENTLKSFSDTGYAPKLSYINCTMTIKERKVPRFWRGKRRGQEGSAAVASFRGLREQKEDVKATLSRWLTATM